MVVTEDPKGWEQEGDRVLKTPTEDRARAPTASYVTAPVALAKPVARLGEAEAAGAFLEALRAVPDALEETLAPPAPTGAAERLAGAEPVPFAGFGLGVITASGAALLYEQGTYAWAEGMTTEAALQSAPAAFRPGMGAMILVRGDLEEGHGRASELHVPLSRVGVDALTGGGGEKVIPCSGR